MRIVMILIPILEMVELTARLTMIMNALMDQLLLEIIDLKGQRHQSMIILTITN